MKINHKIIQTIIRTISIGIFMVSVGIKLRNLVIYGGTRLVKENEEGDEAEVEYISDDITDAESPVSEYPSIRQPATGLDKGITMEEGDFSNY